MIVVWGKKPKRVACDPCQYFCVICRSLVWLTTTEVRNVQHLYYLPTGKGDHILDEGTCEGCRTVYGFVPGLLRPLQISPEKAGGLRYISEEARPSLNLDARARLEERVANQRITGDERIALIAEPFQALEYELRQRSSSGSQESVTAVMTVLLIFLLPGTFICWYSYWDQKDPQWLPWTIGCTAALAVLLPWLVMRVASSMRRAARGEFVERIGISLAPLKPSESEIDWTLKTLKEAGSPVAAALTTEQVMKCLPSR